MYRRESEPLRDVDSLEEATAELSTGDVKRAVAGRDFVVLEIVAKIFDVHNLL